MLRLCLQVRFFLYYPLYSTIFSLSLFFFLICLNIFFSWVCGFQLNSAATVEVEHGVTPIQEDGYKWRLVLAYDGTHYAGLLLFSFSRSGHSNSPIKALTFSKKLTWVIICFFFLGVCLAYLAVLFVSGAPCFECLVNFLFCFYDYSTSHIVNETA